MVEISPSRPCYRPSSFSFGLGKSPGRIEQRFLWNVVLALLILTLLAWGAQVIGLGNELNKAEHQLLDTRLRLRQSLQTPADHILILGKDIRTQEQLLAHPEYRVPPIGPLPRQTLAEVIGYLKAQGALAIILDVEFREHKDIAGDRALAQAIQNAGNVYSGFGFGETVSSHVPSSPNTSNPIQEDSFWQLLSKQTLPLEIPTPEAPDFPLYRNPMGGAFAGLQFLPFSKGIGAITVDYFGEGYLRSIPAIYRTPKNRYFTHLGVRAGLDLLDKPHLVLSEHTLKVVPRTGPSKAIPLDHQGQVLINWKSPQKLAQFLLDTNMALSPTTVDTSLGGGHLYRTVSLADVLQQLNHRPPLAGNTLARIPGQEDSGQLSFKDKIVVYGDTVKDLHRTPVDSQLPGAEVVASVVDMIQHDSVFVHPVDGWPYWLAVWAWTLLVVWQVVRPKSHFVMANTIGLLGLLSFCAFNFVAFVHWGLWLPIVLPALLLVASFSGASVYKYWWQDREKRQLTTVFSNYVSPQVMTEILKAPHEAMERLQGRKQDVTVLFTDIKGFTSTFEQEDPARLVDQMNDYFDAMVQVILAHQGTIDKYIGDAIMAFFGAPQPLENHAELACRAAVAMQAEMGRLNEKWAAEGKKRLAQGISLSSGEVFVGNFGARQNKSFTVMGSVVNLGSRLESLTRTHPADIILSRQTAENVMPHIPCRHLATVEVKGFTQTIDIYSLSDTT